MGKSLAKILAIASIGLASVGCAYETPGLVKGMRPGQLTNKDVPYNVQELVYGTGQRTFVRKIGENKEAKGLTDYLNVALIPVGNSDEIIDVSKRQVRVEGENYVLNSLGRRTVKIVGVDGVFRDYVNIENSLNERASKNLDFRIPTIEIAGKEFYKIRARNTEEATLPLYLIPKQDSEVILRRTKRENRVYISGTVYQPTRTEIVDKPEPKVDVKPEPPTEVIGEIIEEN